MNSPEQTIQTMILKQKQNHDRFLEEFENHLVEMRRDLYHQRLLQRKKSYQSRLHFLKILKNENLILQCYLIGFSITLLFGIFLFML